MRATVRDIIEIMEGLAPPALCESWDNAGLLLGRRDKPVQKALVTLDLLDGTVDEALAENADMIISHHPVIFKSINRVNDDTAAGRRLLKLLRHDVAAYAAHTNLDAAQGGTNDRLFELLGLLNKEYLMPLSPEYPAGMGRVGDLPKAMTLKDFARHVKTRIGADAVSFVGDGGRAVSRVALLTGAGTGQTFFQAAADQKADVYVTGDVTHHPAQDALDLGLALVDATHYYTENLIVPVLCEKLAAVCDGKGLDCQFMPTMVNGQMLFKA